MGKARDAHEVGEAVGVRVVDHFLGERGAELRDAVRAHVRAEFLRADAECLGRGEDGHGGRIVERNGLGVAVGQLLEHLDDGRVIVPEDVKLDETLTD